jgi:hypothetical protein
VLTVDAALVWQGKIDRRPCSRSGMRWLKTGNLHQNNFADRRAPEACQTSRLRAHLPDPEVLSALVPEHHFTAAGLLT